MLSAEQKLNTITQMIHDIGEVKDLDLLLERILTNARKFFNADAGSIYLRDGDQLKFSYTQNDSLQKTIFVAIRYRLSHVRYSSPTREPTTEGTDRSVDLNR